MTAASCRHWTVKVMGMALGQPSALGISAGIFDCDQDPVGTLGTAPDSPMVLLLPPNPVLGVSSKAESLPVP